MDLIAFALKKSRVKVMEVHGQPTPKSPLETAEPAPELARNLWLESELCELTGDLRPALYLPSFTFPRPRNPLQS